jgi:eukaryotic-like serine/threonine-protein kinase
VIHEPRRVGPFRILSLLGSGGMGVVYLGQDRRGHLVAVKLLRPEISVSPAMRARFAREISAAQRVDAMCVPRLCSWNAETNPPWMATEYVAGPTLETFVTQQGPLRGDVLRAFAASTAEALAAIARVGLVHRDLKPSNVLINPAGPRVIDFGIAISDDAPTLTETGEQVGTATWMAPEQARGDPVGPATDVFSWSALVAYAGTGAHPFGSGDPGAVLYRVLHTSPSLDGLAPDVAGAVRRGLARTPRERPSIDDLLRELVDAPPDAPTPVLQERVRLMLARDWDVEVDVASPPRRPGRGRRRMTTGAIGLAALAIGLAGWAVLARAAGNNPNSAATITTLSRGGPPSSTTSTSPPTTTTSFAAEAALRSADAFVEQQGYTAETFSDFREPFNAIGAVRTSANTDILQRQGHRVFFFVGNGAVGTDTPQDGDTRAPVTRSGAAITVQYDNDQGSGPLGPPGLVRFVSDGSTVTPLDPFPAFVAH